MEAAAQTGARKVPLRSAVEVSAEVVRLSDLLPQDAAPELQARAAAIVLGYSPRTGSQRILDTGELERKLEGRPELRAALQIPERITIGRQHRLVGVEEILAAIQAALQVHGAGDEVSLTAEDLDLPGPIPVTTDDPSLQVMRMEFDPLQKRTRFRLQAANEPKALPFSITARLPISGMRTWTGPGAKPAEENIGPAGKAGPSRKAGIPKLVKAGKPVPLWVQGRAFRISTTAIPLQPGAPGQRIRVRRVESSHVLQAEVTAQGDLLAIF